MGRRVIVGALAICLAAALAAPAGASDDRVRRRGECTGGPSEWKLIVRQETASTLRVKWEIEGGARGQTWQLFISDNGDRIYAGSKTSRDGGEVRVVREIADRAGGDLIKATGVNLATGESCGGSLTF
jgi:hypothetical protein